MNIDFDKFAKNLRAAGLEPGEIGLAIGALLDAEIEKTVLEKLGYPTVDGKIDLRPPIAPSVVMYGAGGGGISYSSIDKAPTPSEVLAMLEYGAAPKEHPVARFEKKAKKALSAKRRIPGSGCAVKPEPKFRWKHISDNPLRYDIFLEEKYVAIADIVALKMTVSTIGRCQSKVFEHKFDGNGWTKLMTDKSEMNLFIGMANHALREELNRRK